MKPGLPVASSTASARLPVLTFLKASMICEGVGLFEDCGSPANVPPSEEETMTMPDSVMVRWCLNPIPRWFADGEFDCNGYTQRDCSCESEPFGSRCCR